MRQKLSLLSLSSFFTVLAYFSMMRGPIDFFSDPGLGWHLKTGEYIAQTGKVPRVDPFLATNPEIAAQGGRPWICDQWLGDLILYYLKTMGGWSLIYVVFSGLWVLIFFAVVAPGIRLQVGGALAGIYMSLGAFNLAQCHFIARPVVFSIALFAVVHRISRNLASEQEFKVGTVIRSGVALVSIFALWSNLHPAFVLGLFLVGMIVPARILHHSRFDSYSISLAVVALCCFAATLLNPFGLNLLRSVFDLGASKYFMLLNDEWLPLKLSSLEGALIFAYSLGPLMCWALVKRSRERLPWFDLIVTSTMLVSTLKHIRMAPYACIAAAYPATVCLGLLRELPQWRALRLTRRFTARVERHEAQSAATTWAALLCAFIGILLWHYNLVPFAPSLGPNEHSFPTRLLDSLNAEPSGGVILATPNLGGYITVGVYPRFRAVLDDRNTLLGEEIYKRFFRAVGSVDELQQMVNDFRVTHVILAAGSKLANDLSLSPKWLKIYEDDRYIALRVVDFAGSHK